MRYTTVALLFVCCAVCCIAQKQSTISPREAIMAVQNTISSERYLRSDSLHRLVILKKDFTINDLAKHGIQVVRSLDSQTAVVNIQNAITRSTLIGMAEVKPVNYLWKLSDNLLDYDFHKDNEYVIKANNRDRLTSKLQALGLQVSSWGEFLVVKGNLSRAFSITLLDDDISYIGLESFKAKAEGRVLDLYHGPNKVNRIHNDFPEMNGSDIVTSIKERQFNPQDIDLLGRSVPSSIADADTSNHATEMATIIAGAGNSFITGKGVATHSKITSSSFANLFPDPESHFSETATYLQNHAYGTVVENIYGALASAYDAAVNQHPKILHVFSSGNSGTSLAASGSYVNAPGFSNLTGNSKMAKNVLVVGSVDTVGRAISLSSRGPANDGRIKPEIVSYSMAGTSNSAAVVSGVAAILQQAFHDKMGTYPDAALLKAILINAADDVGLKGIDFITGFGNLNAYRSLTNLLDGKYFEGTISQGQILSFDIVVPENARNLKATLVWTDAAAEVNSSVTLINNLDLELMSAGDITRPWILDPTPTITALSSLATRGVDNVNNVEQVTLDRTSFQTYKARVKGASLKSSSQKFYIAYQWDEDKSFIWNYPTASDNFPYNGETGTYFYWKSLLEETNGDLELSYDDGQTWNTISADIDLTKGYHRWENPDPLNVAARARMVVGNVSFETEEFTISRTLIPSVGFNCADSALLQWNAMENVGKYEIRKLDGNYTVALTVTPDTLRVIQKNTDQYFAIQPMLQSGKLLLRSPAVNLETYGAGCFVSTFVDELISDEGILLRLELGTTYGVSAIVFEHEVSPGKFETIYSQTEPGVTTVRYLHTDPTQGLNRYRARIKLNNGQEVLSEIIQNYYLTETPFIVFPNPVAAGGDVSIFSGKFDPVDFQFKLYKSDGVWIRSASLASDREFVNMEGLSPGLYLYRIEGSQGSYSGKIVIR